MAAASSAPVGPEHALRRRLPGRSGSLSGAAMLARRASRLASAVSADGQRRLQAERRSASSKDEGAQHHDAPTLIVPSAITVPEKILPLSMLRTLTRSPAEPGCKRHRGGRDGQAAGDEHDLHRGALLDQQASRTRGRRDVAAGQQRALGDLADRARRRACATAVGSSLPGFSVTCLRARRRSIVSPG